MIGGGFFVHEPGYISRKEAREHLLDLGYVEEAIALILDEGIPPPIAEMLTKSHEGWLDRFTRRCQCKGER